MNIAKFKTIKKNFGGGANFQDILNTLLKVTEQNSKIVYDKVIKLEYIILEIEKLRDQFVGEARVIAGRYYDFPKYTPTISVLDLEYLRKNLDEFNDLYANFKNDPYIQRQINNFAELAKYNTLIKKGNLNFLSEQDKFYQMLDFNIVEL